MANRTVLLILNTAVVVMVTACASTRGSASREECVITRADSAYMGSAPLHMACTVDRPARAITRPMPQFTPPGIPPAGTTCYTAEVRFVVGPDGRPEEDTIRLLRTTYNPYGQVVLSNVHAWRYQPAQLNDQPVRQLLTEETAVAVRVQVVAAGQRPPDGPPRCL